MKFRIHEVKMEKTFILEEIKKAFWLEFHESGELWFPYRHDEDDTEGIREAEQVTGEFWKEFVDFLNANHQQDNEI